MPQAVIEAIAAYLVELGASAAVATAVATVVVYAVASFALGKISQALASGQSESLGKPPPYDAVHIPAGTQVVRVSIGRGTYSQGTLGGFQSAAAKGWRVVGFSDHEEGAEYFDA